MKTHDDLEIDVRKGEFSPTMLETYLTCPRKFYLQHVLKIVSRDANTHFVFGSAIHAGVAQFYVTKKLGASPIERKLACLKAFTNYWEKMGIMGTEEKNLESGLLVLSEYCNTYMHDGVDFLEGYIETDFCLFMPNGTTLKGIIDRVTTNSGRLIVDTKSSKSPLTEWFWKKFENSFQLLSYYNVGCTLLGELGGVQVDAIRVPYKKSRTGEEQCLSRRTLPVTTLQREEWMNTYLRLTDRIMDALAQPDPVLAFYQNHTSCSNYGECEYLDACIYGLTHPSIEEGFEKGTGVGIEL